MRFQYQSIYCNSLYYAHYFYASCLIVSQPIIIFCSLYSTFWPKITYPWQWARLQEILLPPLVETNFHLNPNRWTNLFQSDNMCRLPSTHILLVACLVYLSESNRRLHSFGIFHKPFEFDWAISLRFDKLFGLVCIISLIIYLFIWNSEAKRIIFNREK